MPPQITFLWTLIRAFPDKWTMEKTHGQTGKTPETNTHLRPWATPPGYHWKGEATWYIDATLNNSPCVKARGHFGIDQEETRVAQ